MPAGAGEPLLVAPVAVVMFPENVLFTKSTTGASVSDAPPPS